MPSPSQPPPPSLISSPSPSLPIPPLFDVLILGAGPAGLSTALGVARQQYTALVFDSGIYRNDVSAHMHNFLTWDHRDPGEFRKRGREEILERYRTVWFRDCGGESVRIWGGEDKGEEGEGKEEEKGRGGKEEKEKERGFVVVDKEGREWRGRKLVLATGVRDCVGSVGVEGYEECWGRGIYHCLFCHGYEDRGAASAGVLAIGAVANVEVSLRLARMLKRLTSSVTIYTNGVKDLSEQLASSLGSEAVIKVDERPIARFEKGLTEPQVIMHFADGSSITESFLAHKPKTELNGPFARQLALELTEQGDIKTSQPFCETSVAGVFAVGDCAVLLKVVAQAVSTGSLGAVGVVTQLQGESG